MDPYERLGISRTSSEKQIREAYEEKLALYPEESEERTEVERAFVVIRYERGLKSKKNKIRGLVIAGVLLIGAAGGMVYYLGGEESEAVEDPKKKTSFVVGEQEQTETEEESEQSTIEPEPKESDESQEAERDREEVIKLSEIFFTELEDSLTNRSVEGLSVSTPSYNATFQSSLDDLKVGGYIFDGELSVREIGEDDIKVDGNQATATVTVDYSSRSYQPDLHERPAASSVVWKLELIKKGGDWLVDKRTPLSDSATGRGMDVRDEVKQNIIGTISSHAQEWADAYQAKDVSYFTHFTTQEYLERQRSYYDDMNANEVYWEGYLDRIEYSPSSIKVSEVATSLTATIEVLSHYEGDYFNEEDGSLDDPDDGAKTTFRYHLKYEKDEGRWYITSTDKLKGFTAADTEYY
ncbi:hypothetical protein [Exiguobacterium flavidum]|uniref:hypothetical protein n=1 Tax=Exiguobacterium flavidum TaxID=2184695 RepID=UPI000DF85138|nr:hypothetical protein [Exiguobacterium flavidum]